MVEVNNWFGSLLKSTVLETFMTEYNLTTLKEAFDSLTKPVIQRVNVLFCSIFYLFTILYSYLLE